MRVTGISTAVLICAALLIGTASSALLIAAASPAAAAGIKYYPDPVYKKLNADDPLPMDEMLQMAKDGDTRAMFIIADMYQKAKGGFARDPKEAERWFGESAMHGYGNAFVRLAAIAKHAKKPVEAWGWYTLAIDALEGAEQDYVIKARHDLVEAAELSDDDIRDGRKFISDWKDKRDAQLKTERAEEREKKKQEKLEKEKSGGEKSEAEKKHDDKLASKPTHQENSDE